jgi:hypothetical protein
MRRCRHWHTDMVNLFARNQFAAANGWKVEKSFGLDQLIQNKKDTGSSNRLYTLNMFSSAADHPEYFRRDGYPMALLGHNYPGTRGHYIEGVKRLGCRTCRQDRSPPSRRQGGVLVLPRRHAADAPDATGHHRDRLADRSRDGGDGRGVFRRVSAAQRNYLIACARA